MFRKGASKVKISGVLGCDDPESYLIGGRKGQRMSITLWSKGATASILDKGGDRRKMPDDSQSMAYRFPYTGDVTITLLKPSGGATAYDLFVTIR
jgi:hypothetical protein